MTFRTMLLAAWLALPTGAFAGDRPDDAVLVRAAISAQLKALKAGDAEGAYALAAPSVQRQYRSPERFLAMVRRVSRGVYSSSIATFGEMKGSGASFRQDVFLVDPSGRGWDVRYRLIRQKDGSLKITTVQMRRSSSIAI